MSISDGARTLSLCLIRKGTTSAHDFDIKRFMRLHAVSNQSRVQAGTTQEPPYLSRHPHQNLQASISDLDIFHKVTLHVNQNELLRPVHVNDLLDIPDARMR